MRYNIEIEGRKIRLINTVKLVMEPKAGFASSYSRSQADHWVAHLASKGISASLVPTGEA